MWQVSSDATVKPGRWRRVIPLKYDDDRYEWNSKNLLGQCDGQTKRKLYPGTYKGHMIYRLPDMAQSLHSASLSSPLPSWVIIDKVQQYITFSNPVSNQQVFIRSMDSRLATASLLYADNSTLSS